jgi:hypothetical protein
VTLSGHGAPLKRVVWIGWRRVDLERHPRPADVAPIRVSAAALAPGMPQRDLLLSPDHAVFVAGAGPPGAVGALVPVRYLVNGASIRREPAVGSALYFHVELAEHDLLLAEGLPAESYLDTGNRGGFANGGGATQLHMDLAIHTERALRIWRQRACAALLTSGPGLAELRRRLQRRAPSLGWHRLADPELRLDLAGPDYPGRDRSGQRLRPTFRRGEYHFTLPGHARRLRLVSRHVVPAEIEVENTDHRRLGVAVAGLRLDGAPLPLDRRICGDGWHMQEPGLRWTDGNAMLILPEAAAPRMLTVSLRPLLHYWHRFGGDRGAVQIGAPRVPTVLGGRRRSC